MTLNLIETFKTSIYSPKHNKIQNYMSFFKIFKTYKNPYFQNNKFNNVSIYSIIYILCCGPHSLTGFYND